MICSFLESVYPTRAGAGGRRCWAVRSVGQEVPDRDDVLLSATTLWLCLVCKEDPHSSAHFNIGEAEAQSSGMGMKTLQPITSQGLRRGQAWREG